MSSSHVKFSFLYLTIVIIIQSRSSHDIPTAKFGWNQLLQLQNRICKDYCEDIDHWNYRSSKTIFFCTLNCPITFTTTTKNLITPTTTTSPTISPSLKPASSTSPTASTNLPTSVG